MILQNTAYILLVAARSALGRIVPGKPLVPPKDAKFDKFVQSSSSQSSDLKSSSSYVAAGNGSSPSFSKPKAVRDLLAPRLLQTSVTSVGMSRDNSRLSIQADRGSITPRSPFLEASPSTDFASNAASMGGNSSSSMALFSNGGESEHQSQLAIQETDFEDTPFATSGGK